MSRNTDLIRLLKTIKHTSISKEDMKYNKIFKDNCIDSVINYNEFANEVRKKWMSETDHNLKAKGKYLSTNDKLKQIINSNRNACKMKEKFFKTFNKEPLFKYIIKKGNIKEILKKNNKSLSPKIKNIIEKRKKFKLNSSFLKRRHEENNRQPPLCLYTPKYNYIYKHSPIFYFHNDKSTSRKNNMLKKNKIEINSIKNNDNEAKTENENDIENNNSLKKDKFTNSKSLNKLNHSLTPIYLSKIKPYISYIDDDINKKIENIKTNRYKKKLISLKKKHNNNQNKNYILKEKLKNKNKIKFNFSTNMEKKNMFVPNFDKMISRNLKSKKSCISNEIYFPNYDAIFSGVLNNKPIDYEYRKKSSNLKKIICIYNPTSEYQLFPELNNEK
jgi:hypothetical protein